MKINSVKTIFIDTIQILPACMELKTKLDHAEFKPDLIVCETKSDYVFGVYLSSMFNCDVKFRTDLQTIASDVKLLHVISVLNSEEQLGFFQATKENSFIASFSVPYDFDFESIDYKIVFSSTHCLGDALSFPWDSIVKHGSRS